MVRATLVDSRAATYHEVDNAIRILEGANGFSIGYVNIHNVYGSELNGQPCSSLVHDPELKHRV